MTGGAHGHSTFQSGEAAVRVAQFCSILDKWSDLAAITGRWPCDCGNDGATHTGPAVDRKRFARRRASMSEADFSYHVYCYLLDVDVRLEAIARAQGAGNMPRLAREARILARMAGRIGAVRTRAAAARLEEAGSAQDRRNTGRLTGELTQSCAETERQLRNFLDEQARLSGAA